MDWWQAAQAGAVAGLAIAAPLGAIAVLLLEEGLSRGLLRGLPAAAGVAAVDTAYCSAALLLGAVVAPVVTAWAPWPAVVGGVALILLGLWGLWRGLQANADTAADPSVSRGGSGWRRFALFVGLTAINPATLLYFAAVVTGLGGLINGAASSIAFVVGVGVASWAWQSLLVCVGGVFHQRMSAGLRRASVIVGNSVVALLGMATIAYAL